MPIKSSAPSNARAHSIARSTGFRLLVPICCLFSSFALSVGIPDPPADNKFVQDYAGILPDAARQSIGEIQARAFNDFDTAIVIVTVRQMADYGYAGSSIETFAADWFNQWQIGKRGPSGLINKGVLLIVSVGDRKARIELGADWGRGWDAHCAAIMSGAIVPQFKNGRFADGILAGVRELASMAEQGPAATPSDEQVERTTAPVNTSGEVTTSPIPRNMIVVATVIGLALIGLSFFLPEARKPLLIAGIVIIAAAWFFWIILFVFAMFSKRRGRAGGGFSGGGFRSGGFSGGGGASGSW